MVFTGAAAADDIDASVDDEETADYVEQGQTASVFVDVTNNLDDDTAIVVEIYVGDTGEHNATQTSELSPGESEQVELQWDVPDESAGHPFGVEMWASESGGAYDEDLVYQEAAEAANVFVDETEQEEYTVVRGETFTIDATLNNDGGVDETTDVDLFIHTDHIGTVDTADDVTIERDGGTTDVTLEWETDDDQDVMDYEARIKNIDEQYTFDIRVTEPEPAYFDIVEDDIDTEATEGDDVDMAVTVKNTGDVEGTRDVSASVSNPDGTKFQESVTLTLAGGESTDHTFTWVSEIGDAGSYNAAVNTDDARGPSEQLTVDEAPPDFQIESVDGIPSAPHSIEHDDTVEVTATVTNVGGAGSQDVALNLSREGWWDNDGTTSLELAHGQTDQVAITTQYYGGGEIDHTVATDNDSQSEVVWIGSRHIPTYDYPTTVEAGEEVTITASVTNEQAAHPGQVILGIGTNINDSTAEELEFYKKENIDLGYQESTTITGSWQPTADDIGTWELGANTIGNDTFFEDGLIFDEIEVVDEISEPAFLAVSIPSSDAAVQEGETASVDVTIQNTGTEPGDGTIELSVSDGVGTVTEQEVSVDGGSSETVTLEWETGSGDAGEYTLTVESNDDASSTDLEVLEEETDQPRFSLSMSDVPEAVTAGETVTVDVIVTNTGGATGTESVTYQVGNIELGGGDIELDPGSTGTLEFEWGTDEDDIGTHELSAYSEDRITTDTVEVVAEDVDPANFDVSIVGVDDPVTPGETVVVDATVTNTGEESDAQDIDFGVEGDVTDDTPVSLDPDGSSDLTFEWQTGEDDVGTYELAVLSDDDSDTASVTVGQPQFEVTVENLEYYEENGSIAVEATIENTGPVAGSQEISASGNGTVHDSQTLELGAGESGELSFSWELDDLTMEQYDVEIASLDDADEGIETLELDGEEEEDDDESSASPDSSMLLFALIAGIVGVYLYSRVRGGGDDVVAEQSGSAGNDAGSDGNQ